MPQLLATKRSCLPQLWHGMRHPESATRDEHECDKPMNYDGMSLISIGICDSGWSQVEGAEEEERETTFH